MATTLILLGGLSPDYVLASSWGFGQSVLHKLVIRDRPDQLDRVEQLLREGADVNAKTTGEHKHPSRTLLFNAVLNGNSRMVELLLAHGADPNILNGPLFNR
ncbi:MAG: hypothetical protein F4073_11175 [Rhodobacteraceae bacterium]|nr:ankyrin repeat domain-containing protein [Paracoccaceae bacterium]MXZ51487.1 hypothetical protein [Paracoccaceae bacterium]MYF47307.1 hypothetical protein [Paracoccaceae bacterium]MYI92494.1 hypothetical protein [Paracoccaceae bacterium]